jgi:hypothetical protein
MEERIASHALTAPVVNHFCTPDPSLRSGRRTPVKCHSERRRRIFPFRDIGLRRFRNESRSVARVTCLLRTDRINRWTCLAQNHGMEVHDAHDFHPSSRSACRQVRNEQLGYSQSSSRGRVHRVYLARHRCPCFRVRDSVCAPVRSSRVYSFRFFCRACGSTRRGDVSRIANDFQQSVSISVPGHWFPRCSRFIDQRRAWDWVFLAVVERTLLRAFSTYPGFSDRIVQVFFQ